MKERKDPARALVLLTLATGDDGDVNPKVNAQASACPDPEEIAAMAEGQLSWERRSQVMRHLAVCAECYRIWLEVARRRDGSSLAGWRWPRLSFKTLGYAGGALAAVAACLAVFLHPHLEKNLQPPGDIHHQELAVPPSASVSPAPTSVDSTRDHENRAKPIADRERAPSIADKGDIASTTNKATNGGGATPVAVEKERAEEEPLTVEKPLAVEKKEDDVRIAASVAGERAEAGSPVAQSAAPSPPADIATNVSTEKIPARLAAPPKASIHINAVEVRRSSDQLSVWYGDLREMCRQSGFAPDHWASLYARGASILEAMPDNDQNEETDRLWLILGQMEGLTAERRQTFCAWLDRDLARKLEKKARKNH